MKDRGGKTEKNVSAGNWHPWHFSLQVFLSTICTREQVTFRTSTCALRTAAQQENIKDGKLLALCKLVLGILQLSMINREEGCSEEETLFPIQGHSQLNFLHIQGKDHLLYQRAETLGSSKNNKNVTALVWIKMALWLAYREWQE